VADAPPPPLDPPESLEQIVVVLRRDGAVHAVWPTHQGALAHLGAGTDLDIGASGEAIGQLLYEQTGLPLGLNQWSALDGWHLHVRARIPGTESGFDREAARHAVRTAMGQAAGEGGYYEPPIDHVAAAEAHEAEAARLLKQVADQAPGVPDDAVPYQQVQATLAQGHATLAISHRLAAHQEQG